MVQVAISSNQGSGIPQPKHKPKLGFFIYILAITAAIGGFLFGYDTGIVSEAMLYVEKNSDMKPINDIWKELIVAITPGIAGIGSLVAGNASDRFGRKKVILIASVIFTIGGLICAASTSKEVLLVGRVLLGFAIGVASMIVPVYVSEASPANIRGLLVTGFQLMITFGLVAANIIAGSFSYIDPENVLKRIYNGDEEWIEYELEEIRTNHEEQVKAQMEHGGDGFVFLRILATPHVRKALLLGCTIQAFSQMSGINTVMYYTGTIIKSAGIRDIHENIWISCVTAATVYQPGDHRDLYTYNSLWFNESVDQYSKCIKYSNCDYCVTNENCGFCTLKSQNNKWGFCLPGKNNKSDTVSDTGYCNNSTSSDTDIYHNITLNGTSQIWEWDDSFCHSKYTFLPIVFIVIYLACFASGLNLDEIEMLFMGKEEKQRMQENIRRRHLTKSDVHENGDDKSENY
uniref:Major facilitator superfamily (MFS) profile domain-containing protein n=1 Tax=Acrobeloides nanus TaxID=290746 RepID=A0A914EAH8_9BILA